MIKKLFLFILISINLFANENYELRLYEHIFPLVFNKDIVKVYDMDALDTTFDDSIVLVKVNKCEDADFIFMKSYDNGISCQNKPIFAIKFKYIDSKDVFGVFYWKKGRPQLWFNNTVIKEYKLNLPKELRQYVY